MLSAPSFSDLQSGTKEDRGAGATCRPSFVLLRHGETDWNLHGLVMGQTDIPLNSTGLAQAEAAAEELKSFDIGVIYTSSLSRCLQTAAIISSRLRVARYVIPDLAERSWGVLEGRPRSDRIPHREPLGGETRAEFQRRVARALATVLPRPMPLIVTHSGVIRLLCRKQHDPDPWKTIPHARPIRCWNTS